MSIEEVDRKLSEMFQPVWSPGGTVLECLVSRKDFARDKETSLVQIGMERGRLTPLHGIDGAPVHMHKYLCPGWQQINHANGNGLDRRENLRGVRRAD
jgi:hypothetical protein